MLPTRVLTSSGIQENDPTYSPYILAAVRKELKAKGLTEVTGERRHGSGNRRLARAFPQLEALIYSFAYGTDWGTASYRNGRALQQRRFRSRQHDLSTHEKERLDRHGQPCMGKTIHG